MTSRNEMQPDVVSPKLTYEDFLRFPEDGRRHELIAGEHYVTASPETRHQRILRRLSTAMDTWLASHPLGEMFFAPFDVKLSEFDVVVPDLIYLGVAKAEHVQTRGLFTAPDLVVEILSPSTRKIDEGIKRSLYERVGVEEYWVINPKTDTVTIYRRMADRFDPAIERSRASGGRLTTSLLPGLEIALSELLA
jgi:Uma2 family endonuclease